MRFFILFLCASLLAIHSQAQQRVYKLKVHQKVVDFTGVRVSHALAINDSIPAPVLRFEMGDIAVIHVHNATNEPITMHWHGLLVPWRQDGPQFTNTKIIAPLKSQTYRFTIRHTGTYWYHSHTALQEQRGLYGGIVVEDKPGHDHVLMSRQQAAQKERDYRIPPQAPAYLLRTHEDADASTQSPPPTHHTPPDHPDTQPPQHKHKNFDHDRVVVISDWTNELPMAVLHNIKKDGHWYNMKRNFFPSIVGAIKEGRFGAFLKSEWSRMGAMDLADIGYDAFLMNGQQKSKWDDVQPGQRVRLRLINAAASTYFYINLGKGRSFQVISKDGRPVVPIEVNEILMGIGETFDIVFNMPMAHPPHSAPALAFAATAHDVPEVPQDIIGSTHIILGQGKVEAVPRRAPMPLYSDMQHHAHLPDEAVPGMPEPHNHNMPSVDAVQYKEKKAHHSNAHEGHAHHQASKPYAVKSLHYKMLRSTQPTKFNDQLIRAQRIDLHLTGDMERYTWHINGKPFTEDKFIDIAENEVVTFRFINKTMMYHPMHLHGHFFRVLNGQGEASPLMHTVSVAPHETIDIEFHANEPGLWYLHCHNLYHMKMGMSRLVRYKGFDMPGDLQSDRDTYEKKVVKDNHTFWRGQVTINSVHGEVIVAANKGRYDVIFDLAIDRWELDHAEAEIIFRRYLTRLLSLDFGGTYESEAARAVLGLSYVLPGTVRVRTYLRHDKQLVVRLRKAIPITARLFADIHPEWKFFNEHTDYEFEIASTLGYRLTNKWALEVFHLFDKHKKSHAVGGGASWRF